MEIAICACIAILAGALWHRQRRRDVPHTRVGFCETSVLLGASTSSCSCGRRCAGLPLSRWGDAMYNMINEHHYKHAR